MTQNYLKKINPLNFVNEKQGLHRFSNKKVLHNRKSLNERNLHKQDLANASIVVVIYVAINYMNMK